MVKEYRFDGLGRRLFIFSTDEAVKHDKSQPFLMTNFI